MQSRVCRTCLTEKDISEYYKTGKTFTLDCKVCYKDKIVKKHFDKKNKCVEYKGGKCMKCGYDKYVGALEFHHKNPEEKEFCIGNNNHKSFEDLIPELDKCELLCSNCHKEEHANIN